MYILVILMNKYIQSFLYLFWGQNLDEKFSSPTYLYSIGRLWYRKPAVVVTTNFCCVRLILVVGNCAFAFFRLEFSMALTAGRRVV